MIRQVLKKSVIGFAVACSLSILPDSGHASDLAMKGPKANIAPRASAQNLETSSLGIAFLGAIRFYQKRISPIGGGNRCGFSPSCSAYGYEAIREQGPLLGVIMIGDRQIRCNIWKHNGPDYTLLPNGKLYDPPAYNLLFEKANP